jgi:hypothetical protein
VAAHPDSTYLTQAIPVVDAAVVTDVVERPVTAFQSPVRAKFLERTAVRRRFGTEAPPGRIRARRDRTSSARAKPSISHVGAVCLTGPLFEVVVV